MRKYTGIDVSKATLDVVFYDGQGRPQWKKVGNDEAGFREVLSFSPLPNVLAMEASGPYHLPLAMFLHANGRQVSVANPLQVKHFCRMKFHRAKTDRKDARYIADYGNEQQPGLWEPGDTAVASMQQVMTAIEGLHKQVRMSRNQLDAFKASGSVDPVVAADMEALIERMEHSRNGLEARLEALADEHYADTTKLLRSVPGIGPKAAAVLTIVTNNFRKFDGHKQLVSHLGMSPRVYSSGTSVRGRGHICKMGGAQARKILYMCSLIAARYNEGCKQLYVRLRAKGKPIRVVRIAIAVKLVRIAFAVVKSGKPYDKNFREKFAF